MTKFFFAVILSLSSFSIFATETVREGDFTCQELKQFIREKGGVYVMQRVRGRYSRLYKRYVQANRVCFGRSKVLTVYARTSDTAERACHIGWECLSISNR